MSTCRNKMRALTPTMSDSDENLLSHAVPSKKKFKEKLDNNLIAYKSFKDLFSHQYLSSCGWLNSSVVT